LIASCAVSYLLCRSHSRQTIINLEIYIKKVIIIVALEKDKQKQTKNGAKRKNKSEKEEYKSKRGGSTQKRILPAFVNHKSPSIKEIS
jgi:hypothetical protein